MVSVCVSYHLDAQKLISDQPYGPVCLLSNAAAFQRPPDPQRTPSMPMPVPMTTQYGSLHIPEGYIPPSVNPPVVPQDVISPRTDPEYWRRAAQSHQHQRHPSQNHHGRPSQSHPPVMPVMSVNPPVMPMPRPFSEPTSTTVTSTLPSPPFKPFEPLPEYARTKPPTPPPKLLDLAPYRDTLSYLSHPSPASRTRALEIIQNKEMTDIHRAHEEWRKQDEEREKVIREKREERERLIGGRNTIRAPTMQTVTALMVDPTTVPPPPPPKEKRPLWRKLFRSRKPDRSRQQPAMQQHAQVNAPVIIPIGPQQVLPSIPGVVMPMQMPTSSNSNSHTHTHSSTSQTDSSPTRVAPTPAVIPVTPGRIYGGGIPNAVGPPVVMPSPFLHHPQRSTTPDISPPPTAAFYSIPTAIHM